MAMTFLTPPVWIKPSMASKKNASAPAPGQTLVNVAQEVDFLLTGLGD